MNDRFSDEPPTPYELEHAKVLALQMLVQKISVTVEEWGSNSMVNEYDAAYSSTVLHEILYEIRDAKPLWSDE